MEAVIAWCGFLGAWLLVAGPIWQAAQELGEIEIARERIAEAGSRVPEPERVSRWWWLVPPVKFHLEHRRSEEFRIAYVKEQRPEDVEDLLNYRNKAAGWLMVGTGGFLIATKETWELREHYEWSDAVFGVLLVLMLGVSIGLTISRERRQDLVIDLAR